LKTEHQYQRIREPALHFEWRTGLRGFDGYGYGFAQTQSSSWAPNTRMDSGGGWWNSDYSSYR